ncbi:hypothetical protein O4H52_15630 [Sphingomonadaceae bacterium G21617-S1]|uniref:hypothetical protein n=1 Tax=Rhizorhabdus sp. TaxID=1968843 RepID=UPI001209A163|nr:hypothetical protein [Rhizorhabdus sp.]MBD3759692.1 hypothetical protein [Rhizorhabdus sp.]MCZ4343050.1 hypothetical protein [Sphingomonadaceae bacterium G21617-S1]TAK11190.1 MAG: hypothetical protein EPO38_07085 [Rhizorhabdus sp.]
MRNEDQQPETGTTAIETVAESQTLQSRRGLLRIATLGTAAVVTVKPGIANAAVSAITCSIPVPQSSQANKWIKSDGSVVNPNTKNSYDPPNTPLSGEDVKNSLAYGTRYSGYNQNETNAFNKYIQKLTMGKQGYTCYSSIQRQI